MKIDEDVDAVIIFYDSNNEPGKELDIASVLITCIRTHGVGRVMDNLLERNQTTIISSLVSMVYEFRYGKERMCAVCRNTFPLSDGHFYRKGKNQLNEFHHHCKSCHRAVNKVYSQNRRDKEIQKKIKIGEPVGRNKPRGPYKKRGFTC